MEKTWSLGRQFAASGKGTYRGILSGQNNNFYIANRLLPE
jgi:hypothetical protein